MVVVRPPSDRLQPANVFPRDNPGMNKQPQPRRPLTDLTLAELRRALRATLSAAGPNSYSVAALRKAILDKKRLMKGERTK